MAWKAPKIVEVSVGMEINMYMCANPQVSGAAPSKLRSPVSNGGAFLLGLLLAIKSREGAPAFGGGTILVGPGPPLATSGEVAAAKPTLVDRDRSYSVVLRS